MNSDFDSRNASRPPLPTDAVTPSGGDKQPPTSALDQLQRDRFELLSAYLDGEVTAAERRQVDDWLKSDPVVRCLYARLLKLRHNIQAMPVPAPQQQPDETIRQVFARIDRRFRLKLAWGGMAIAAVIVGAVFGDMSGTSVYAPQAVQPSSADETVVADALMIALDRPVIEIPKAPVSASE